MLKRILVLALAASVAAAPSSTFAQELSYGERRSGAAAGVYFSIPFGGRGSGELQSGLRLQIVHDYRDRSMQNHRTVRTNALDLRLTGEKEPTLYVADLPVTGKEARKQNLTGAGTLVTVLVLASAAVGAVVIIDALKDDDDDERQCFLPEGCP